jgi:predicted nucleotidyltransferase
MDRDAIIERLSLILLSTRECIACAYLFGSLARGNQRVDSDIDIAVLFEEPPPGTLLGPVSRLQDELEHALKRPVDVVALNTASPDFVHRVLRDGVLLNENDASRRIAFEVQARNAYFDLLPYLTLYRQAPGQRA